MCSIADDEVEFSSDLKVERGNIKDIENCKKCSMNRAYVLLQKKHSYCKQCFLVTLHHKFRATIGKTKQIKPEERILIMYNGNSTSTALLHLIVHGMQENTHKRIRFVPVIFFVDESELWTSNWNKHDIFNDVLLKLSRLNMLCYFAKLGAIYCDQDLAMNILTIDKIIDNGFEENTSLQHLFQSITNATSKNELLTHLRLQLSLKVAKHLNCTKIFTSECATDLSIRLLSNTAVGRGAHLPHDVGIFNRLGDVVIYRPLHEISIKEICFFNVFSNADTVSMPTPHIMFQPGTSIQQTTEAFVVKLQEDFPSTVYTILRTGNKLKLTDDSTEDVKCILCVDNISDADYADSVEVIVQKPRNLTEDKSSVTCSDNAKDCVCKQNRITDKFNEMVLCYGCRRIINDIKSLDELPASILHKAEMRSNRGLLRNEIEEFLL